MKLSNVLEMTQCEHAASSEVKQLKATYSTFIMLVKGFLIVLCSGDFGMKILIFTQENLMQT